MAEKAYMTEATSPPTTMFIRYSVDILVYLWFDEHTELFPMIFAGLN